MKPLLATILTFAMTTLALAGTPKVTDQAGFFSPDAVSKANQRVQDIKRDYGKDVILETFATIPADQKARYSDSTKNEFFVNWARGNARAQQDNGLYILICRDPAHLQVEVGNQTRKQAFTLSDRDHLRDLLVTAFRDKNYDAGLTGALDYVDQTFKANGVTAAKTVQDNAAPAAYPQRNTSAARNYPAAPPQQPRSSGSHLGWLWILILVFGAFFLIRMIIRRATGGFGNYGRYGNQQNYAGNTPPPVPGAGYGPNYGGGGGGGFGRGLLGGLLGGAAGSYLYDRMSHPHNTAGGYTTPPPADQGGGGTWGGGSPTDTSDFAGPSSDMGGGGDFGDAGGSSFDSGGGGFDSGGGGGDSGGGGGGGDF